MSLWTRTVGAPVGSVRIPAGRGKKRGVGEEGLSLLEALVVLVLTSLILSILLPISSRAVAVNLRIGVQGLETSDRMLAQTQIRRLLESAVPPRATARAEPSMTTVAGRAREVVFVALLSQSTGCVAAGAPVDVTLAIEDVADGGGRLVCRTSSRETVLMAWPEGDGVFSFSRDGAAWRDSWPGDERAMSVTQANQIAREGGVGGTRPVVDAPLVRLQFSARGMSSIVVRAGRAKAVRFEANEFSNVAGPKRIVPP